MISRPVRRLQLRPQSVEGIVKSHSFLELLSGSKPHIRIYHFRHIPGMQLKRGEGAEAMGEYLQNSRRCYGGVAFGDTFGSVSEINKVSEWRVLRFENKTLFPL